jgi:hypothetical protein
MSWPYTTLIHVAHQGEPLISCFSAVRLFAIFNEWETLQPRETSRHDSVHVCFNVVIS